MRGCTPSVNHSVCVDCSPLVIIVVIIIYPFAFCTRRSAGDDTRGTKITCNVLYNNRDGDTVLKSSLCNNKWRDISVYVAFSHLLNHAA